MTFEQLTVMKEFTRKEYYDAYLNEFGDKSPYTLDYALRKEVSDGSIVHVGRNRYSFAKTKRIYKHVYSSDACDTADLIQREYSAVDFQIFELTQMNSFVNHLFAHNTIFVSVENEAMDYVFDTLRSAYPGKILLKPKVDEYYRYLVDGQIVITRLPSESPKGVNEPWQSGLEKILVDISVDKLLSQIVSEGECQRVFNTAFDSYLLDMGAMRRYANRKGAGKKFNNCLRKYAPSAMEE